MPALPPVAKVIRVDFLINNQANSRIKDRMFFAFAGAGPAVADLVTLSTTIANAWGTNIAPHQSNLTSLIGLTLTDLTSNVGAQTVQTTSKPGTLAGAFASAGVAAIIKFKIARRYRGGHPRFYLGQLTGAQLGSSTLITAAEQASLATAFQAFVTACEAAPPAAIGALTHVNVSYFVDFINKTFPSGRVRPVPQLRGTPLQDSVVSYSVNPIIASQRRRNQQSP